MIRHILVLALATGAVSACAARSGPHGVDPSCLRRGEAVEFATLFSDEAEARSLIEPLLAERDDTIRIGVFRGPSGPEIGLDTTVVADSVARGRLEARIASLVSESAPKTFYRVAAYRAASGAEQYDARWLNACAPVLLNRDEVGRGLARAQASLMTNATVRIRIFIDETGTPLEVEVHETSGEPHVDATAVALGYTFRFAPAMHEGEPREMQVLIPVQLRTP